MKTSYSKFIIPLSVMVVILIVLQQKRRLKRATENFHHFDQAAFAGRIQEKPSVRKGSVIVRVNGKEYTFYPYTSDLNNNTIFESVAQAGDSIFKEAKGDTLYLVKPGGVLKYTFHTYDE
ncbi:MAG TPA: hypothetical protein VGK59_16300 [Ohtaekwangia sp.]